MKLHSQQNIYKNHIIELTNSELYSISGGLLAVGIERNRNCPGPGCTGGVKLISGLSIVSLITGFSLLGAALSDSDHSSLLIVGAPFIALGGALSVWAINSYRGLCCARAAFVEIPDR